MTHPPDDEPTCGKGLAAHAPLPAALAALAGATADVLEEHLPSLDPTDEPARAERAAYERLVREHRDAADRLRAIAERMAGYRDLPMGRHDLTALAGPAPRDAFARFVQAEEALVALLQERLAQDREMLAGMGGA